MYKRNCRHLAFTLVELLVVIAVIALLMSIIIPTLTRVKERARRTICQSNIRSFHMAITGYAVANDDLLPQGGGIVESGVYDYIFLLKREIHESLAGNANLSFVCPNLFKPFKGGGVNAFNNGNYIGEIQSYLIGYNYLGGFAETPWALIEPAEIEWTSPQKITDNPRTLIITELNTWIGDTEHITFAPHGYWGPIHESRDSTNQIHNGVSSDKLGAVGGHICTLDGAIKWKDIEDMKIHRASTGVYRLFAYW